MPKTTNVHPIASKASAEAGTELETSQKRTRRNFTAAEKLRILVEADACTARGELEALMRRKGIYSSHLSNWRAQHRARGSEGLAGAKPGCKPKLDANDRRIQELERKAARLVRELLISQKLVELQKKPSWGRPTSWTRNSAEVTNSRDAEGATGRFLAS